MSIRRIAFVTLLAGAAAWPSCGGGSSPTGGTPTPSPSSSTSPTPPAPTPSSGPAGCPFGKGTISASCFRGTPSFLDQVDAAINQLLAQKPQLFDLTNVIGPGSYLVKDTAGYYQGVIANLESMGYCAGWDFTELQVKNSNEFSDQYSILLSSGHIRRGAGSYRSTCRPAIFPLDPEDVIASIRVAFFGIRCPAGRTPPRNGEGVLPIGCTGTVTATPKNKDNVDVDPRVHGSEVFWRIVDGADHIDIDDFPDQPFNKNVTGRREGDFTICASVKGIEGCLHAKVIP